MWCKLFKIVHKYVIILIVDYNIKYDKFSSLLFKIVHKYVIILIVDYNIKYDKFSSLL